MTRPSAVDYLGADIADLLAASPFSGWKFFKSVENDLPKKEIRYEFEENGVDVICDEANRVRTVFLRRGGGEGLSEVPFSLNRRQVLERYGPPSKSGTAGRIPVLGEHGAWDRFTFPNVVIHVQYQLHDDQIDMVTVMDPHAAP